MKPDAATHNRKGIMRRVCVFCVLQTCVRDQKMETDPFSLVLEPGPLVSTSKLSISFLLFKETISVCYS